MPDVSLVDARRLPTYDLGNQHPFAPDRQRPLADLLDAHGLVAPEERSVPEPATDDDLTRVHRADYVRFLAALDPSDLATLEGAARYGMGTADNPIRAGQHAAAAAAAGGTLDLARRVLRGELRAGFNPAGGLHHAMPGAASGFCLYNDCAVAIAAALEQGATRIAYVDFDVHHGDGVERCFEADPRVLTISFHQSPDSLWPFTGRADDHGAPGAEGSVVNVPLAAGTSDASWQTMVTTVLDAALGRFRPELIVTQHGCDTHHRDPLADLSLTTRSFLFAAQESRRLADRFSDGRWVATGGGGYQPYTVLPLAWTAVWCVLAGRELPERVDTNWCARWGEHASGRMPRTFLEPEHIDPRAEVAADRNDETLAELHRLHGW